MFETTQKPKVSNGEPLKQSGFSRPGATLITHFLTSIHVKTPTSFPSESQLELLPHTIRILRGHRQVRLFDIFCGSEKGRQVDNASQQLSSSHSLAYEVSECAEPLITYTTALELITERVPCGWL